MEDEVGEMRRVRIGVSVHGRFGICDKKVEVQQTSQISVHFFHTSTKKTNKATVYVYSDELESKLTILIYARLAPLTMNPNIFQKIVWDVIIAVARLFLP